MFDYKLNTNSDENNTFEIQTAQSGCCGTDRAVCEYAADVTFPVTSFTAKNKSGVDVVMTFAAPATTVAELIAAINLWVKKNEDEGGLGGKDFDEGTRGLNVSADIAGTGAVLGLVGVIEFVSINAGGVDVPFIQKCTKFRTCDCQVSADYDTATDVTYNGVTETFAATPAASLATAQTNAETVLATLNIPEGSVVVTEDTDFGGYLLKFSGEVVCSEITSGSRESIACGCKPSYKV